MLSEKEVIERLESLRGYFDSLANDEEYDRQYALETVEARINALLGEMTAKPGTIPNTRTFPLRERLDGSAFVCNRCDERCEGSPMGTAFGRPFCGTCWPFIVRATGIVR